MRQKSKIESVNQPNFSYTTRITYVRHFLLPLLWWAVLWLITGDDYGLPGGIFFALWMLMIIAVIMGLLAEKIYLPPLLGMLLAGFIFRNIPFPKINGKDIFVVDSGWSSAFRNSALVIILTRAGLGLKLQELRRQSASVLRLSFLPNIFEAVVDSALAVAIFGMPWTVALMLGFVISAVSPAVVVPSLLRLQDLRYGTEKGIPTLVLAAASFDDVLSISAFGIFLGLSFSKGKLWMDIIRAPLELTIGIGGGLLLGWICYRLTPPGTSVNARVALLLGFGLFAVFGGKRIEYTGAGALAVIIIGLTASYGWGIESTAAVKAFLKSIWVLVAQPLLFVLIGSAVSVEFITPEFLGQAVLILFIGLIVRLLTSVACVWTKDFVPKERLFIAFAWFPKATVQAAIGSVALDTALELNPAYVKFGQQILTVAVLSILITAPIGAAAIAIGGPRLLSKQENESELKVYASGEIQTENDPNKELAS